MGFILGLAGDVAANVIFWALLGFIFWAFSTTVARRFSRFFGLARATNVAVFLSNLWTPQAGTLSAIRLPCMNCGLRSRLTSSSVQRRFASPTWYAAWSMRCGFASGFGARLR